MWWVLHELLEWEWLGGKCIGCNSCSRVAPTLQVRMMEVVLEKGTRLLILWMNTVLWLETQDIARIKTQVATSLWP